MSNYWERRAAKQMHEQMKSADDYLAELARYYFAASQETQRRAKNILNRYRLKNNITQKEAERILRKLDPEDIKAITAELAKDPKNAALKAELTAQANAARMNRLKTLFGEIKETCEKIAERTEKGADSLIKRLAKEAYYKARYMIQKRANAGHKVEMLDDKLIEKASKRSWAGSGFSERIWGNTEELEKAVKREVMTNLLTGRTVEDAARAINEEFGKGMNNARRLVRTETAYMTNQMTLEGYKAEGVEKYIYVAVLDLRTSKICQSLDKKRFLVKDAKVGENYPPMHPWCRSTTIAWMPDSLLKKIRQKAIDPKTGKRITVPGNMTYEEWHREFVEEQPASAGTTQAVESETVTNIVSLNQNAANNMELPETDTLASPADSNHGRLRACRDLTKEYIESADPGRGLINYDKDYNVDENINEIATAKWIHDNLGGDIRLRKALSEYQKKDPDYEWMGTLWDLKTTTTENAANSAIRSGMAQIEDNPGGVILNYGEYEPDMAKLLRVIDKRMKWYPDDCADILIISKGKLIKALRY